MEFVSWLASSSNFFLLAGEGFAAFGGARDIQVSFWIEGPVEDESKKENKWLKLLVQVEIQTITGLFTNCGFQGFPLASYGFNQLQL